MKKEEVEIYSDESNYAVMRHPGRSFPGSLIQGDSLYSLCNLVSEVKELIENKKYTEAQDELEELSELLLGRLEDYKSVLKEHNIELPFYEENT